MLYKILWSGGKGGVMANREIYGGGWGGTWTWVCAWPRPFYAWGKVGTHLTMVNLPNP